MFKEKDFKSIERHSRTLETLGRVAARSPDSIDMAELAQRTPPFDQDKPEIPRLVLLDGRAQSDRVDISQGPSSPAS